MKPLPRPTRPIVLCLVTFLSLGSLWGQGPDSPTTQRRPILFVYEEANEKIDPWMVRFRNEFHGANVPYDEKSGAEMASVDLKSYDLVVVYGAVMAFTAKEPIRDWLTKEQRLSGTKVGVFVTANRWFLKEYSTQLADLLRKRGTTIVDAVSAATETLKEDDKTKLVRDFVRRIHP